VVAIPHSNKFSIQTRSYSVSQFSTHEVIIIIAVGLVLFSLVIQLPPGPRGTFTTLDDIVKIIKRGIKRNQKKEFKEILFSLDKYKKDEDEKK